MLLYLALLVSSTQALCACLATGDKCQYNGIAHRYRCSVPAESTCPDKYKTNKSWDPDRWESMQACDGFQYRDNQDCYVTACAGGSCLPKALRWIIYKAADGQCYKAWEGCTDCLDNPGSFWKQLSKTGCPEKECSLPGQAAASFDCRGRCAAGFNCHQQSGQCRSDPNTPQTSCVATCASGFCCNKAKNQCLRCGGETAVGGQSPCFGLSCSACITLPRHSCVFMDHTCFEPQYAPWSHGTQVALSLSDCQAEVTPRFVVAPSRKASIALQTTAGSEEDVLETVLVYGFSAIGLGALLFTAGKFFTSGSKATGETTVLTQV